MKAKTPKVLLVGENRQGSTYLVSRLEGHGCTCRFAASYQEACSLLRNEEFDLVLSPIRLCSGSVFPLIDVLEGSRSTMFYSHAVEDSCWWLPALLKGDKCFGSPALRPSEFIDLLDRIIGEIRSGAWLTAASRSTLLDRVSGGATSPPEAEPSGPKPSRSKDAEVRPKAAG